MEIECKTAPPPGAHVVYCDQLSRLSRASGRFVRFTATLCHEMSMSGSNQDSRCTLYLVDDSGEPFSCVIFGSSDIIRKSAKDANAFSISGKVGGKTVLRASSRESMKKWLRILNMMLRGEIDDIEAAVAVVPTSTPPLVTSAASCIALSGQGEPTGGTSTPVVKGLLFKKGGRTGRYIRRWFELVRGDALYYAAYGDSPRESFHRIPLKGLPVAFADDKRQIVIPPTVGRQHGMTLKCHLASDFAVWREAIHAECSDLLFTGNEDCRTLVVLDALQNVSESRCQESLSCADEDDDSVHHSSTDGQGTSFAPASGTVERAVSMRAADYAVTLTDEEQMELEDLQSDTPCGPPAATEELLESIGEKYRPLKNTVGIQKELQKYYAECLPYGLEETLQRLRQRLAMPIREPYEAVNKHKVLLDLDVERVRACLRNILSLYGEEVAVCSVVKEMDYVLRLHMRVRERLLIRLEMAAFCEQPNQNGLALGINGSIKSLDTLLLTQLPTEAEFAEAVNMWRSLFQALQVFRLAFDVFDESKETIVAMENALDRLYVWMQRFPDLGEDLR